MLRAKAVRAILFSLLAVLLLLGAIDLRRAGRTERLLSNAVREAARVTVSTPLTSRNCLEPAPYTPCSIQSAAEAARGSLAKAGFNRASCITPHAPSFSGVLIWVYSCDGSESCDSRNGSVCLKIDRTALELGSDKSIISVTRVTIQYPHAWTLGSIAKLLPRGPSLGLPNALSASAVMRN